MKTAEDENLDKPVKHVTELGLICDFNCEGCDYNINGRCAADEE